MKQTLALALLGVLTPMLQSVASVFLPARLVPDLGFLFVVGLGLYLRSAAAGLLLAALVGYVTDLLSGSLLGQHALLRVLAFGAARLGSRQLNLRGPLPQALFIVLLTTANALAAGGLTAFFATGGRFGLLAWRDLPPQIAVNAALGPLLTHALGGLLGRLRDDDAGSRPLRLELRSWSA